MDEAALVVHVAHAHYALDVRVLRGERDTLERKTGSRERQHKKNATTTTGR